MKKLIIAFPPAAPMIGKVRGYEVKCSPWMAELLGAQFTNSYRGRGVFHYWDGYLWWISA